MGLMNIIPGWKYLSAGVGIVILLAMGYWAIATFVIGPRDYHPVEREALEHACEQLIQKVGHHLDQSDRRFMNLALPEVQGDTSQHEIHFVLHKMIEENERLHPVSDGVLKQVQGKLKDWLGGSGSVPSAENLLASKGELDAVLLTKVQRRGNTSRYAHLDLEAELYEWKLDKNFQRNGYQRKKFKAAGVASFITGERGAEQQESSASGGFQAFWWSSWRVVVCLIGAFTIPFIFLPFTDFVQARAKNILALLYLGIVVAFSMLPWTFLFLLDELGGHPSQYVFGFLLLLGSLVWSFKVHDTWSERV